jgi:NADPH-dependent 2,4-dienoyl-CoA reductase/sulfur reductase-like enzyme
VSAVTIVGAGPAGLSCAVMLRCHGLDGGLQVFDPSGAWLITWRDRFRRQDIPHLRSPAVHHPHPDPFALLGAEGPDGLVPSGGTKLPTTERFERFVDRLVDETGLGDMVTPRVVRSLTIDGAGRAVLHAEDGSELRPERVVLATNARRPVVPRALLPLDRDPRVLGADRADVHRTRPGMRLAVVGGGLSAIHLALRAARRGAEVTLLARRRLAVRRFDTHPTWLGPKRRRPFEAEPDPVRRRRAIDNARGGGSVPPRIHRDLLDCVEAGRIDLLERTEPVGVEDVRSELRLRLDDGTSVRADAVWYATGGAVDVSRDRLCASLLAAHPVPVAGGPPVLDPDLTWPGTNVHLTGFAAALVLGPTAGNLVGHRRAAQRLAASLRGDDPDRADRIASGAGACPAAAPRRLAGRRP